MKWIHPCRKVLFTGNGGLTTPLEVIVNYHSQTELIDSFEYSEPDSFLNEYDCGDQTISIVESVDYQVQDFINVSGFEVTLDSNNPAEGEIGTFNLEFFV